MTCLRLMLFQCKSDSLEWNLHGSVDFRVVLRNWLDILVPSVFSAQLLDSLLLTNSIVDGTAVLVVEASCECLVSSRLESTVVSLWARRLGSGIPLDMWSSQKWNCISKLLRALDLWHDFVFIRNVSLEQEWGGIERCLESALGWSHGGAELGSVLHWHCLDSLPGNWFTWSILSEEFRVGHSGIIEGHMIIHWSIKILSVPGVPLIVIFRAFDIEVRNPAEFSINVTVLRHMRVVWHPRTLNLIHLVWVVLSPRLQEYWLFLLECFVEILSIMSMVSLVKQRWALMMALIPLFVAWSQHTIISIFLHDKFGCCVSITWVITAKLGMSFENISQSFASKWRLSICGSYWWSKFRINYNVFCVWHID